MQIPLVQALETIPKYQDYSLLQNLLILEISEEKNPKNVHNA